jgi:hypothetical protein
MRTIEKIDALKVESEWDLARGFVQLEQWPYFVQHEPDLRVDAHYHRTTEELQVLKGAMTFFPVGSAPAEGIALQAGERAKIPEGTVHRVTIGPDGVTYVMGLGRSMSLAQFAVPLPVSRDVSVEIAAHLVEVNYHIAEAEETGEMAKDFFEDLLSPRLVFAGAFGDQSMSKARFIEGLEARKDKGRRSSGLRLRREGAALAASIVVTTRDGGEFLNVRLFEREPEGRWRCVRWSNAQAKMP